MASQVPPGADDPQLSFPLPPSFYYKHYTDDAVKKGVAPPPPKVVTGDYMLFGHTHGVDDHVIQPLESQGIKRLYSTDENFDHIVEMKKLNHSILVNYLELLDVMIDAPHSPERVKKIEEIKILFINLHHLINEFRPHQARETLRIMLHRQKKSRLETAQRLRMNIEKARDILKTCGEALHGAGGSASTLAGTGVVKSEPMDSTNNILLNPTEVSQSVKELRILQNRIMCDIADGIS